MLKLENNQEMAAAKAGMDRKTACKYLQARRLPSELPQAPRWRTRADAFEGVWEELRELLQVNPGLAAAGEGVASEIPSSVRREPVAE